MVVHGSCAGQMLDLCLACGQWIRPLLAVSSAGSGVHCTWSPARGERMGEAGDMWLWGHGLWKPPNQVSLPASQAVPECFSEGVLLRGGSIHLITCKI